MGKKPAAKAAPKAKKPTSKVAPKAKAVATKPGVEFSTGESVKDRKLARRDTDDAADRVMEDRLYGFFDPSRVAGAVNRKGEKVADVIKHQIRVNRSTKKRLGTAFWTVLIDDFHLVSTALEDLPAPADASVRKEFTTCLELARANNTSERSLGPFIDFLETVSDLTYGELFKCVRDSLQCPVVTPTNSTKMLMALTKYIARCTRLLTFRVHVDPSSVCLSFVCEFVQRDLWIIFS